jgi:2-polyprenyl-6-hydroxyphenyl methylase / 3-demethylubiquinone-9 3-methyltransferase
MLRKDIKKAMVQATAGAKSTVDPAEIARFERLADEWWKPDGAFKVVHGFNRARVGHLAQRLPALCGRSAGAALPLAGLSILDVGCGAGIVTEPLSRLGGDMLGIDAAERNVLVAQRHAALSNAPVRYRHAVPEELNAEGRRFDIVLSLEVVEHVASVPAFLEALGGLVAPGGLLVIGTLNRTPVSFIKAIVGAEYVLGWLPRGTHDWRRFVTPAELAGHLAAHDIEVIERCGVELNPLTMQWRIARSTRTTYLQFHRKRLGGDPVRVIPA